MKIPKMTKIRHTFNSEQLVDIEGTVREQIAASGVEIGKGAGIAIAVGSRGVANIAVIAKTVADWVKEKGGEPFIVPAMGSHGGATAIGQKEVLEGYGITEDYIKAPIKSSMEVVELTRGNLRNRVYMDKYAYEADGTIIINRIKVHTDFHGPTESGLLKMCVIGLGKHKQALEMHKFGVYGLKELIPPTARQVLKYGNIIMGIGIVENAYDQTAVIRALKPSQIEQEEMKLLDYCRMNMPSLPVRQADVLLVDKMGKDISGTGMDTNIIGRIKINSESEPEFPRITNIAVSDLTEASHGNAVGMGLADIVTRQFFEKIDFRSTYENVLTSGFLERGKIPVIAETDRQALTYALRTCGPVEPENARIIRIKDTLHLEELFVTQPVLEEISGKENIEVIGGALEMFDAGDRLVNCWT